MDATSLQAAIDSTKAQITVMEATVITILTGTVQSYTTDTGQTRLVVVKFNITEARKQLDSLYSRLEVLCTRKNGNGSFNVRQGF